MKSWFLTLALPLIRQAAKKIDYAVLLLKLTEAIDYVVEWHKTKLDNFIFDSIKACLRVYIYRVPEDTVYSIANKISLAIAAVAEEYREFNVEGYPKQGIKKLREAGEQFENADTIS